MTTTSNKRKKAAVAAVAAAAFLLAGTFAWTSISQIALNESAGIVNVGGRLHDDFNGENKDIYVENFTDPLDGGQPIYARVRLDEYMEVGQDAGGYGEDVDEDGIVEATPVVAGTDVNNVDTWEPHIPEGLCTECTTGETCKIHDHWTWEMGGQTTYMPTFNKDKDSLKSEINGTYEGLTEGDTVHYDDYVVYEEGDTLDGNASYDDDTNTVDDDVVIYEPETHTAKKTANGTVIPMSQWIAEGELPGPYWVYDTDGWAYWAQPIMPGEATGLLLSSIDMTKNPGEKCYYGINVVGQFATVSDWEYFTEGGEPTAEAERLLEAASQVVPKVSVVNVNGNTTLAPGESADFTATTSVGSLTGYAAGDFEWTVYNEELSISETSTITDNGDGSATLTVGTDEKSPNLIVVAKSTDDAYAGAVGLSSVTVKVPELTITDDLSAAAYVIFTDNEEGDGQVMTFLRSSTPVAEGSVYNGKTINKVYSGFETEQYTNDYYESPPWLHDTLWGDYVVREVEFISPMKPKYTCYWFRTLEDIEEIRGLEKIDNTELTDVNHMFYDCESIESLDLTFLGDASRLNNISGLFAGCSSLEEVKTAGEWNTQNVTDLSEFFSYLPEDYGFDITKWDLSNVNNIDSLFYGYGTAETELDLSNLEFGGITSMYYVFAYYKGKSIDVTGWDTSNVTDMNLAFYGCENLTKIKGIEDFDMTKVSRAECMFQGCPKLGSMDLSSWEFGRSIKANQMFYGCGSIESLGDLSGWNVNYFTTLNCFFYNCKALSDVGDISVWDTSNVENMAATFQNCSNLKLDLSGWSTAKVGSYSSFNSGAESNITPPTWPN